MMRLLDWPLRRTKWWGLLWKLSFYDFKLNLNWFIFSLMHTVLIGVLGYHDECTWKSIWLHILLNFWAWFCPVGKRRDDKKMTLFRLIFFLAAKEVATSWIHFWNFWQNKLWILYLVPHWNIHMYSWMNSYLIVLSSWLVFRQDHDVHKTCALHKTCSQKEMEGTSWVPKLGDNHMCLITNSYLLRSTMAEVSENHSRVKSSCL